VHLHDLRLPLIVPGQTLEHLMQREDVGADP
jgi:hypothetical protein